MPSGSFGTPCARRVDGLKFKRQVPIGRYIADFMCFECKLIVELDGSQHVNQVECDLERTCWLEAHGFHNHRVLLNLDSVVEDIWTLAVARRPRPLTRSA